MKALGLNPAEQEMIDMTNEVAVNGLVYFPDFCKLVLRKYREDNKELLNQTFFKVTLSNCWSSFNLISRSSVVQTPTPPTSEQRSTKSRTNSSPRQTSSS